MIGAVEPLLAVSAYRHETGLAQKRQMLRHARVTQIETVDELADGKLVAPDVAQDLLPPRLSHELKRVHRFIIARSEMYATFAPSLK